MKREALSLLFLRRSILIRTIFGMLCLLLIAGAADAQSQMQTIWQMAYWESYETACTIILDEDRQPTNDEIRRACGDSLYQTWLTTPACNRNTGLDGKPQDCYGLFLRRVGQKEREDPVSAALINYQTQNLRRIRFDVANVNCSPGSACDQKPELLLIARGPDDNDSMIDSVHIRISSFEGACKGNACQIRLPLTEGPGVWLEYWAMDSSGYQSDHFWLKFRIVQGWDESEHYYYDVIGDAFPDASAYASEVWFTFPTAGRKLPAVLEKVPTADYLMTKYAYSLLASKLLRFGKVDASSCPNYGLNLDGMPNGCGELITARTVFEYQNQYDQLLFDAARKQKVPPRVVKGLIAQESQFWPVSEVPYEYGLGMLTESGADMLLRWNTNYYLNLCAQTFRMDIDKCFGGFSNLTEEDQIILRGVVISKIGTDEEIEVLAAAVRGSVYQVNQVVTNATGQSPAEVSSYEDLWKFTIANYYSGSGCLLNAMKLCTAYKLSLNWENVKRFMTGQCQNAAIYVDRVYELGD